MKSLNELIQSLEDKDILKTPAIRDAFLEVDRADFVLPEYLQRAYEDKALPIEEKQTISQPMTVAFMLELLQPAAGQKILDIGTGSGWTTGLLAKIVGPDGRIFGIERISTLKESGEKNLKKYGFPHVSIKTGNGADGWPEEAPFDRILVNAAAKEIPQALKDQLKTGGKLILPLDNAYGHLTLLEKTSEGQFAERVFPGFSFVPFIDSCVTP